MSPELVRRQAALAAAALLATLGVLALTDSYESDATLRPAAPIVRWETALVGVLPPRAYRRQSSCGSTLDSGTVGVAHPLLPCGVDLVVALGGRQVRAEVVEHRRVGDGHEFDLTQALADRLGVHGRQRIQWRFAG